MLSLILKITAKRKSIEKSVVNKISIANDVKTKVPDLFLN